MIKKTIENTSPKRQRVNESQSVHSLALRACKGAEHGAVQLVFCQEQVLGAMRADGAARLRSFAAPSAKMRSP
jgi:hypothetical protein